MAKVLIIDDEPNVLDFLERCIRLLGHDVVRAADCREGLAAMADPAVRMVVADIRLPDSPGPEAWIEQIAAQAGQRPVVLVTGHPSTPLRDKAAACGINDFLSKPFELSFLDKLVTKLLPPAKPK